MSSGYGISLSKSTFRLFTLDNAYRLISRAADVIRSSSSKQQQQQLLSTVCSYMPPSWPCKRAVHRPTASNYSCTSIIYITKKYSAHDSIVFFPENCGQLWKEPVGDSERPKGRSLHPFKWYKLFYQTLLYSLTNTASVNVAIDDLLNR